jgi:ubiquinone/menaquinone biosynthesis C-methylase UbiE
MADKKKKPIAQDAYDALAEAYTARVDTKPHNAYYERPAALSLLSEVKGLRVLDAGCGPGVYAEWLVNQGAEVLAFDANEKMVRFARERLGDRAQIIQANLEQPLDFLADNTFDVVICSLVMDYVRDWGAVFEEFYRVLKAGGYLVFSVEHPYFKFNEHRETSNYFEVEEVSLEWRGFGVSVQVPSYRRPMSEVIEPLLGAGFELERILEPIPTEKFKEESPEDYEELSKRPGFLCIRAAKMKLRVD